MKICKAESNGNPSAINWNDKHYDIDGNLVCVSSQGLFQIACFHPDNLGYEYEDLLDPVKNIEMAYRIWESSGWRPWTTYQQIIALAK